MPSPEETAAATLIINLIDAWGRDDPEWKEMLERVRNDDIALVQLVSTAHTATMRLAKTWGIDAPTMIARMHLANDALSIGDAIEDPSRRPGDDPDPGSSTDGSPEHPRVQGETPDPTDGD